MTLRILFIGFNNVPLAKDDEEFKKIDISKITSERNVLYQEKYDFFKYQTSIPTLYDYNIVFLANPTDVRLDRKYRLNYSSLRRDLDDKKSEFQKFLEKGFILCTFLRTNMNDNYEWCPTKLDIVNKGGEKIIIENTPFKKLLESNNFHWDAHFETPEKGDIILARNIAGHPISIIRNVGMGKIIFLPCYGKDCLETISGNLFRQTLDIIKKHYITMEQRTSSPPSWINKYKLPEEEELLAKHEKTRKKILDYNFTKQVLYETGLPLVESVSKILSDMGFRVKITESKGKHDIEIRSKGFTGIIEVKGKESYANLTDARQLLDWHLNSLENKDMEDDIKPIFIVNHYRKTDIKKREKVYSESAIELGKKNGFCLMNTTQLFELYKEFLKGDIEKENIISMFSTDGLLKLENE